MISAACRDVVNRYHTQFLSKSVPHHKDFYNNTKLPAGKVVTRLEYQAYSKLAVKTMTDIIRTASASVSRSEHSLSSQEASSLIRCAIHHRLGTVPVGEVSIGITQFSA